MHQQIADIFPKSLSYLVLRIEVLALAIYGSLFSKGFLLFKLLFLWFDLPFVFDCFACLGYVLFSNMDILCNRWYINRMVPYFYFKYKKHSNKLNDLFIAFLRKLMPGFVVVFFHNLQILHVFTKITVQYIVDFNKDVQTDTRAENWG